MARSAAADRRRVRARSSSKAQEASLSPKVMGSAWTPWVRPIISVPAWTRAPGHHGGDGRVQAGQDEVGGGAALEGQGGVHDIAAGEPVVEVAALLADRFGDLRDEGHDVVVGGALQLGDAGDVHAGARRDGLHGGRRHVPALGERAQDRQLHPEHVLEAALLGPQRRHRRQRVAPDHALTRGLGRRSPRMMVWVRSGPTLTTATGAPASDSTAST